jgi:hypothetical protein
MELLQKEKEKNNANSPEELNIINIEENKDNIIINKNKEISSNKSSDETFDQETNEKSKFKYL